MPKIYYVPVQKLPLLDWLPTRPAHWCWRDGGFALARLFGWKQSLMHVPIILILLSGGWPARVHAWKTAVEAPTQVEAAPGSNWFRPSWIILSCRLPVGRIIWLIRPMTGPKWVAACSRHRTKEGRLLLMGKLMWNDRRTSLTSGRWRMELTVIKCYTWTPLLMHRSSKSDQSCEIRQERTRYYEQSRWVSYRKPNNSDKVITTRENNLAKSTANYLSII